MRPANPAPAWPHAPASPRSIMPTSSATTTMKLMRERGIFAVPTFAVLEYFADHAATPQAGGALSRDPGLPRRTVQATTRGARADRTRIGCRSVSARHAGARIRAARAKRHDAARRDPGRHAQRREAARLGQATSAGWPPAITPISSPCRAIRWRISAALQRVRFVMKNGTIYRTRLISGAAARDWAASTGSARIRRSRRRDGRSARRRPACR